MISGSLRVTRIAGIDIRVHVSWFLIAALFFYLNFETFSFDLPLIPSERIVLAAATTLLFFASVLLHELSHSIVARRFRLPVHSITLFLFGGVSNLRREPDTARAEFLMAAVGPFTSFVLSGSFWLLREVARQTLVGIPGEAVPYMLEQLSFINLALGVFNLLPGFPLDGGRVLRSALWALRRDRRWATRVATRGGQAVAGLLALWGIYQFVTDPRGGVLGGTWTLLIAFFLFNAASASYRQEQFEDSLRRVNVGTLMTRDLVSVPVDMEVESLIGSYVLPMRARSFVVERDGRPIGVVSLADLRRVPRDQWRSRRVGDVMLSLEKVPALQPNDDARRGMDVLSRTESGEAPVMDDGRVVGLFERDVVFEYLRMRDELGLR
ncbi:MAG: CBS domain-containing protein [Chloroflexi bacterium]|nr:MAG: CBS domain-containing protein [Chloroflexota bacterium]